LKTDIDCFSCFVSALTRLIKTCTDDHNKRLELEREILKRLAHSDVDRNPVILSQPIIRFVCRSCNVEDPYFHLKKERNRSAWEILPTVEEMIQRGEDLLLESAKAAAAGNVLDIIAVGNDALLQSSMEHIFETGFARDSYPEFIEKLDASETILYIGDNSGEIVFDRLFIMELVKMGKKIIFCVRGAPAMDDALAEDFHEARLDEFAELIDTGTSHLGLVLAEASSEAREAFKNCDIVISKGMGNLETLSHLMDEKIFFLLRAKCLRVAHSIGLKKDEFCFLRGDRLLC